MGNLDHMSSGTALDEIKNDRGEACCEIKKWNLTSNLQKAGGSTTLQILAMSTTSVVVAEAAWRKETLKDQYPGLLFLDNVRWHMIWR